MNTKIMLAVAGFCLAGLTFAEQDPGFSLDFNSLKADAQDSIGSPVCLNLKNKDLSAKKTAGINGKGNAIVLSNAEGLTYEMRGNFNPKQGTVSIRFSPQNWTPAGKNYQVLFEANQTGYRFAVYKNEWNGIMMMYLNFKDPSTGKGKTITAFTNGNGIKPGNWYAIDITWSPKEINFYLNGALAPKTKYAWQKNQIKFATPLLLPDASPKGKIYIGAGTSGFRTHNLLDKSHKTAFDSVTVYPEVLTPAEIKAAYDKDFAK
ncbi:MAG: hypothetical protein IJW23_11060 [Lentisphaeria bacterium]|nr:hypothetical protein [Lentisphaeria bacterium]